MLDIKQLGFSYGKGEQSMSFNFSAKAGEVCAILGSSGSGKSTLLSLLAGFLQATSGCASYNGVDFLHTEPHLRPLSILLQSNNLFPQLSVEENIGLGLDPTLRLSEQQREKIKCIATDLDIATCLQRKPSSLSGGQQQRVAIARILVRERPILLLDEPFSALDPKRKDEMLLLLQRLAVQRKMCVLMVTHSPEDALRIADRFVLIKDGESILCDNIQSLANAKKDAVLDYLGR